MVFISAGHNPKGKVDPGAVANGMTEANKSLEFKNLVISKCLKKGLKVITDKDDEKLGDYLKRIQTGSGSVVLEFHFDSASNPKATGTTALVGNDADRLDKSFGQELVNTTSNILKIKNRGVLTEGQSARGRLGLMREQGTVCLLELCFISNKEDMANYELYKHELASAIAEIVYKYENLA